QIVSTYTLGCIAGAILILFIGDILGRRRSIAMACVLLTIGGILQATSYTLPHMIVGRILSGFGIGINTTTIPMWQSETCKPSLRGKLVAVELTMLVFGFVITNWMNFGFTYLPDHSVSWRFPLGFQSLLAMGTMALLPFLAESPRWLCLVNRPEEAKKSLARMLAKSLDDEAVAIYLKTIIDTIEREKSDGTVGWREVFSNKEQQTFRRICLGAGVNFMQQMGGVNVVAYYLPVVLERSFGFSPRMSLILSAIDSMQWMFWAGIAIAVIERVGRRKLLLFGATGQGVCFAVAAVGLGVGGKTANGVAVAFIFLFYLFFGVSFLAITLMYPAEINSNRSRNVGSAIAMITNWVFVYVVVTITPIGK
ncbi:hexose carrier protein, partial [Aureobasidium pullulans]